MRSLACVAILFLVITSGFMAAGDQEDDAKMARPTFGQSGKLFTISFTPGDKILKVQLTGKTMASVDPDRITLLGKSYPRKGKPYELKFLWNGNHYKILNEIDSGDQIEIQVKDKPTQKSEIFKIEGKK